MVNTVVTKENFRWIILEVVIQVFYYFVTNIRNGAARGKVFNANFMNQFAPELSSFGLKVPNGGVPDCGNGRFAEKLPFNSWKEYNALQFVANSSQWSIVAQVLITVALGIYIPDLGIGVGAFFIVWRIVQNISGASKPGLLAITEPLNHFILVSGLVTSAVLAYNTADKK